MRILQGILLSLFIHFFLVWLSQFVPSQPPPKSTPITVEIVTPSQDEITRQIVRQALAPDKVLTDQSQDPLRFLSEKTQRVLKQSRAVLSGLTENRKQAQKLANRKLDLAPKMKASPQTVGGNISVPPARDLTQAQAQQDLEMPQGVSTIGEALPKEVEVGSFTSLNTDRYLFYSFFSRVEELIRFRWESAVHDVLDTTPATRLNGHHGNSWITEIDVWLNSRGEFQSAHVLREAGLKGFDQAVVQAFMQARLFPHPPQELVESDGFIHLKYAFEVHYEPKVLSQKE